MSSPSSSSVSSEGAAGRHGISLRREAQTRFVLNEVDGFRFTLTAHGAVGMPNEIFLFVRRPYNPTTGEEADEFSNVCSVPDLEEYPAGAPTGTPPFFRLDKIDLVFRSQSQAEEAWRLIREEVEVLVTTLGHTDVLAVTDDVRIGD